MVVTILAVIDIIIALCLTFMVIFQSGKNAGIAGAIGGGADTFLAKNKAKSLDAKLARWTKWVAIAFMVLNLILVIVA